MKQGLAVAVALLSMSVLAGLAAVPVQALTPDCDEDFYIDDSVDSRGLSAGAKEVGQSNVSVLSDEDLKVVLKTDGVELKFEIFELDVMTCERSSNVSNNCDQEVTLDTTGPDTEDSITCTLFSHVLDDRAFDVVLVSQEDSSSLTYEISSS